MFSVCWFKTRELDIIGHPDMMLSVLEIIIYNLLKKNEETLQSLPIWRIASAFNNVRFFYIAKLELRQKVRKQLVI